MPTASKLAVEIVNGTPVERILVFAPNHQQFVYWCQRNGINPHAPNVRCVVIDHHLRGCRDAWYVFIGFPPTASGEHLMHTFNHMKATSGLKNAEVIPDGT
jgi:hypothetical protein